MKRVCVYVFIPTHLPFGSLKSLRRSCTANEHCQWQLLEGCEALTRARIAADMLAAVCARFVVKTIVGVAVAISWCGGLSPTLNGLEKKCSVGVCVCMSVCGCRWYVGEFVYVCVCECVCVCVVLMVF